MAEPKPALYFSPHSPVRHEVNSVTEPGDRCFSTPLNTNPHPDHEYKIIRKPDLSASFWASTYAIWTEFECRFEGQKFPTAAISQSKLADTLEYSRATIQECLGWLEEKNLVRLVERRSGRPNVYAINWDFSFKRNTNPREDDACDCRAEARHHGGGAGNRKRSSSTNRYIYCKKTIKKLTDEGVHPKLAGMVIGRLVWKEEIPLEVLEQLPRKLAGVGEEFLEKLEHSEVLNRYYRPAYAWLIFVVRDHIQTVRSRVGSRPDPEDTEDVADGIPEHCVEKLKKNGVIGN